MKKSDNIKNSIEHMEKSLKIYKILGTKSEVEI
jgi:hypothetical protein